MSRIPRGRTLSDTEPDVESRRQIDASSAQLDPGDRTRLDALLAAVPDFVYFKDTQRRFVEASAPFAAMFGRPIEEIIGRRDEELFPPEVAALTVPDDERVIRTGEPVIDRIEGGEIAGESVWVSTTKVPWRDAQGRIIGLLGISRDITRSKQRSDAMQRAYQQARRLEALGRLAGGVAHDFNNVLTVILGAAEELSEALDGSGGLGELAGLILDAAGQARGLTGQLLRFSRRDPGAPRPVRVPEVLVDLRAILQWLLPDDVRLHVEVAPGMHPVSIDPTQLQQVVLNLALNARDAMPSGGTLSIGVGPVERDGRGGVCLAVGDTGGGLDPAAEASIFEPFFTSKPEALGTGLGLTIVKAIVDDAGGHIGVESVVGQGTSFRVWLPTTAPQPGPVEPAPAPSAPAVGRALLVDDDPLVRRSVARMLRRIGLTVLEADGVPDAVERVGDGPLDLLVTDMLLAEGTGLDVAEALRAGRPRLPVLYISGFTDDIFESHGLDPARLELLPKPFTERELRARVQRILGRALPVDDPAATPARPDAAGGLERPTARGGVSSDPSA